MLAALFTPLLAAAPQSWPTRSVKFILTPWDICRVC
jgi:hypothetical protein